MKVFGCRPATCLTRAPAAGVRKPPREETAESEVRRASLPLLPWSVSSCAPPTRSSWPTSAYKKVEAAPAFELIVTAISVKRVVIGAARDAVVAALAKQLVGVLPTGRQVCYWCAP